MTKQEKYELATKDHTFALELIRKMEKELSKLRFTVRSQRQEINNIKGIVKPARGGYNKDELTWHITSMNDR